jgi:hypothetical protein
MPRLPALSVRMVQPVKNVHDETSYALRHRETFEIFAKALASALSAR